LTHDKEKITFCSSYFIFCWCKTYEIIGC